jgi:hypothetical protein
LRFRFKTNLFQQFKKVKFVADTLIRELTVLHTTRKIMQRAEKNDDNKLISITCLSQDERLRKSSYKAFCASQNIYGDNGSYRGRVSDRQLLEIVFGMYDKLDFMEEDNYVTRKLGMLKNETCNYEKEMMEAFNSAFGGPNNLKFTMVSFTSQ